MTMQACLAILLATTGFLALCATHASSFHWPWRSTTTTGLHHPSSSKNHQVRPWSSVFTVDPANILSKVVDHGGLLIPKHMDQDIQLLKRVLHTSKAELNVVHRLLVLHNLTVSLPDHDDMILIGRVHCHWDSYTKPCLDIELEDVDVLVDFLNLGLTKSNWRELYQAGFPPQLVVGESSSSNASSSTLVRIGSMTFLGNLTVRVHSTPLDKDIGVKQLSLSASKSLSERIQEQSDWNSANNATNTKNDTRRGCTSEELTEIFRSFFLKQIQFIVTKNILAVADDPKAARARVNEMLDHTSASILRYANDARDVTGRSVLDKIAKRVKPSRRIERLASMGGSILRWLEEDETLDDTENDVEKSSTIILHEEEAMDTVEQKSETITAHAEKLTEHADQNEL